MQEMKKRRLGKSKIEVSPLGLGCWAVGGPAWRGETPVGWGDINDDESIRAIQKAFDLGVTFFDTADVYGAGHSERILGKALDGLRDKVVIATKFSNLFNESTKQLEGSDASPAYIRRACDASLKRLGTDHIDLYQFHNGGYDFERAAEVRETLEELVTAGKIRAYGWSTDDPERARFFAEGVHCASVQFQMNVLNDAPEMVQVCENLDLAGINRGPLAMGLLSGKYDRNTVLPENDVRGPKAPEWMRYFTAGRPNSEMMAKFEAIKEILRSGGRSLVQGSLAWLWARSERTIPIPGFKTAAQIEENIGAMRFGPLNAGQMQEIDRLLER